MQQEQNYRETPAATGKERLRGGRGELVLLCGREDFCSEARHELQRRREDLRIADADGIASARRILGEQSPAVILAEERALAEVDGTWRARRQAIESALSLLAGAAPVVWIGAADEGPQTTLAVRSGAVDFVPRSAMCLPAAITMVERRLRGSARSEPGDGPRGGSLSLDDLRLEDLAFGEVLRHELNNPLTGILGNAELLLLEVRRGKLDLPLEALQRLETITALAVRMREAVRQLSNRWETAGENLPEGRGNGKHRPPWPVTD
ncbi:MAG TPA: histidine kinase dimerization/phospho-acceptor domain-containing protein [Candidatus Acidoferrales bacterium]|nr:histidine kinase dimerization/phospho-acceptor domain-containing protein [Candidatus Acidoferrales bacterium]